MGKQNLTAALKQRTKDHEGNALPLASETADMMIDKAYESLFGGITGEQLAARASIRLVPANKLHAFFTAKIGFRKHSDSDLHVLADDIAANGVLEHIKVRPIQNGDYGKHLSPT